MIISHMLSEIISIGLDISLLELDLKNKLKIIQIYSIHNLNYLLKLLLTKKLAMRKLNKSFKNNMKPKIFFLLYNITMELQGQKLNML